MTSTRRRKHSVLLIGSSGGGTATLGHTQSNVLIDAIQQHFKYGIIEAGASNDSEDDDGQLVELACYFWINMDNGKGLDGSTGDEFVSLIHKSSQNITDRGTLNEINAHIREKYDLDMARLVRTGQIDGIISVSSRPELFSKTFEEASRRQIPVTGTGGTSLSLLASSFGVNIVGNAGGSVATTPETKAISFCGGLAHSFGLKYDPWKVRRIKRTITGHGYGTKHTTPSLTSVLNGCLPAFWAVMLFKRFITTVFPLLQDTLSNILSSFDETFRCKQRQHCPKIQSPFFSAGVLDTDLLLVLESYALPIVCAVIVATSRRKTEGVIMAAVLAGCACKQTVIGGLLAGWLVPYGEEIVMYQCILTFNMPATMTNLLTSGLVGICVFLFMALISPSLAMLTDLYRKYTLEILWTQSTENKDLEPVRILFVSFLGVTFCYASKVGWYHSLFLPLILIEMERGDASMLGTLDFLSLVLVSAGVCLGMWVTSTESVGDYRLAKRGFAINLLCGDFIEACYPHMEKYPIVSMSGYIASAISSSVLLTSDCKSSAYLPLILSLWLSDDHRRLLLASGIAFGIPFITTLINQLLT